MQIINELSEVVVAATAAVAGVEVESAVSVVAGQVLVNVVIGADAKSVLDQQQSSQQQNYYHHYMTFYSIIRTIQYRRRCPF